MDCYFHLREEARTISTTTTTSNFVVNKFPNRDTYQKIKDKNLLGADDINVLEDYPGLEWKGEYSSTVTYYNGAIVFYENGLYVMTGVGATGAIPGFDEEWELFGKYGVTEDDVKTALGYTPADSTKYLPVAGGTLTGNLTGKYITGTWLQSTTPGHLTTVPKKIPVFDDSGWIYYRTPAELLSDIGASSGYTLTEDDKTEIAGKVVEDGIEFTLVDMPTGSGLPTSTASDAGKLLRVGSNGSAEWGITMPTALKNPNALTFKGAVTGTYDGSSALTVNIPEGGSSGDSSGSGGALKVMSAVGGYIGIPAADLPEDGVVWMCIADGATNQEYYSGTITMQGGALAVNNMLNLSSNGVIQLNQVAQVSGGIAIYGMSATAYTGVYQVVGAGGADEASGSAVFREIRHLELTAQSDRVDITTDNSGEAFELTELYAIVGAQSYEDTYEHVSILPNGGWTTGDAYLESANKASKSSETWKNNMIFHIVFAANDSGGATITAQVPCGSGNCSSRQARGTGQKPITKVSFVSKFASGCTFTIIGR